MNKTILYVIVVLIILVGGYFLITAPAQETGPIKIGFIGPLTGDLSTIGENVKDAVSLAVDEINSSGGINGRQLEVIYEDGKCNGKDASSAANKLINIDKVPVILGGACSGETMSFTEIAEQAKVVTLSYCSSNPAITNAGDYIFRDYPSDSFQGKVAANYTFDKLGKKKAAILYIKNEWGEGLKQVFSDSFKEKGGTITIEESFDPSAKEFRSQLAKIKATNPEIVYFLGQTETSVPGLKQAMELGLKVPFLGGDTWDDTKMHDEAGKVAEGIMFTVPYSPGTDKFKADMKAKTGSDSILACVPQSYDAVKIIAQVIGRVGTNSEDIKNELYKVDYKNGVSASEISFDKNGDLVGAVYAIKKVVNGKAEQIDQY